MQRWYYQKKTETLILHSNLNYRTPPPPILIHLICYDAVTDRLVQREEVLLHVFSHAWVQHGTQPNSMQNWRSQSPTHSGFITTHSMTCMVPCEEVMLGASMTHNQTACKIPPYYTYKVHTTRLVSDVPVKAKERKSGTRHVIQQALGSMPSMRQSNSRHTDSWNETLDATVLGHWQLMTTATIKPLFEPCGFFWHSRPFSHCCKTGMDTVSHPLPPQKRKLEQSKSWPGVWGWRRECHSN